MKEENSMTAFATEEKRYTVEEYLEQEAQSVEKNEYYSGKIVPVAVTSTAHSLVAINIATELKMALKKKPERYHVHGSELKIFVPKIEAYVYPDAVVVYQKHDHYEGQTGIITNPLLIVEVLSPSTHRNDRTTKFWHYQTLPSFREYVLIEQDFSWVTTFFKVSNRTWESSESDKMDQSVFLQSVDCIIQMQDIYDGVDFPNFPVSK
jgi:Uma2 family endonuclease